MLNMSIHKVITSNAAFIQIFFFFIVNVFYIVEQKQKKTKKHFSNSYCVKCLENTFVHDASHNVWRRVPVRTGRKTSAGNFWASPLFNDAGFSSGTETFAYSTTRWINARPEKQKVEILTLYIELSRYVHFLYIKKKEKKNLFHNHGNHWKDILVFLSRNAYTVFTYIRGIKYDTQFLLICMEGMPDESKYISSIQSQELCTKHQKQK